MKQFLGLLIFHSLLFCQQNFIFDQFLREYKFKIFLSKKEVGFINIKISSFTSQNSSDNTSTLLYFFAEIESYTDIPILFFIGGTYNYETEVYDENFVPLSSKIETKEKDNKFVTMMNTELIEGQKYKCKIRKEKKKVKLKELNFSSPILTAGNAIPLVSLLWDFEKEKFKKFYFIDKDGLEIREVKLEFLGKTKDGFYKIKIFIPYIMAKFIVFLDGQKNIKFAEGMGLEIYSE